MDRDSNDRVLNEEDLREIDVFILDLLQEGRVTPKFANISIEEEIGDYSRGYVQQRLKRFEEHGHVENLKDCGLYELTHDPRDSKKENNFN